MSNRRPPREPQLPTAAHAEQAVIGCILIDPAVLDRVKPIASAADFADRALGSLFAALDVLCEARLPVTDFGWLSAELGRLGVPGDARSQMALCRCVDFAVNQAHVVHYAEQVADAAMIRRLAEIGPELLERVADLQADPQKIIAWLQSRTEQLTRRTKIASQPIADVVNDVLAELDKPRATEGAVFTGIPALDEAMGPLMRGEVCVVAARTGGGKTGMATQWAENVAGKGKPVLVVSLEMRQGELVRRLLCSHAEIDSRDLRGGGLSKDQRAKLTGPAMALGRLPIRFFDSPSAGIGDIRAIARHAKAIGGLDLLVVDYLNLIRPDDRRIPRYEQVSQISAALKCLAKEIEVPLVALAQLNREAVGGAEPQVSHLRESGSIEQDADIVLLLHHPPGNAVAGASATSCSAIIGKHRHGETGKVSLLWHPRETRFSSPGIF